MAAAAAAMAVAAAAAMAAAATPWVSATSAGSPLDAEVAAGSEVARASGSLDAEVAARSELVARSEVAAGSEVAGAAAAGSGSVTSGGPMIGGPGGPAAHPGERAACAKSHDLAAGLTVLGTSGCNSFDAAGELLALVGDGRPRGTFYPCKMGTSLRSRRHSAGIGARPQLRSVALCSRCFLLRWV